MREERRGKREEGRKNWEHLKFVKKTVVGWRSLCGASDVSLPIRSLGSETLPLPIYDVEMLPKNFSYISLSNLYSDIPTGVQIPVSPRKSCPIGLFSISVGFNRLLLLARYLSPWRIVPIPPKPRC